MDKKKEIEEMGKIIESVKLYGTDNYERKISRDSILELAEELLKHYRKIDKDSVVISREEYELLTNDLDKGDYGEFESGFSQGYKIGSKETAEKFYDKVNENICAFKLENKSQEFTDGYVQAIADICGRLDQVAKQFGVEIKE